MFARGAISPLFQITLLSLGGGTTTQALGLTDPDMLERRIGERETSNEMKAKVTQSSSPNPRSWWPCPNKKTQWGTDLILRHLTTSWICSRLTKPASIDYYPSFISCFKNQIWRKKKTGVTRISLLRSFRGTEETSTSLGTPFRTVLYFFPSLFFTSTSLFLSHSLGHFHYNPPPFR